MAPEMFEANRTGFGSNIVACYDDMRRGDLFSSYVVLPPQAPRNPERLDGKVNPAPALRVTAEQDDGIVINGIKLLGTAAVFSDMIWIGNLSPLAPDQQAQAVTCAVPIGTQGVSLWVRKPYEQYAAERIRQSVFLSLRRIRRRRRIRECEGAVGTGLSRGRRCPVAGDVFAHARAPDEQPSVGRSVPREAQADAGLRLPRRGDERGPAGPGGSRNTGQARSRRSEPEAR